MEENLPSISNPILKNIWWSFYFCAIGGQRKTNTKIKNANSDQRAQEKNNKLAEIIFLIHIISMISKYFTIRVFAWIKGTVKILIRLDRYAGCLDILCPSQCKLVLDRDCSLFSQYMVCKLFIVYHIFRSIEAGRQAGLSKWCRPRSDIAE